MGNTLRRLGNTATCIAAPLLYQLRPALPFVLFSCLTLVWTCALGLLFAQRARECGAEDVSCFASRSVFSAANLAAAGAKPLTDLQRYLQKSFVSQERQYWAMQQQQQQQLVAEPEQLKAPNGTGAIHAYVTVVSQPADKKQE